MVPPSANKHVVALFSTQHNMLNNKPSQLEFHYNSISFLLKNTAKSINQLLSELNIPRIPALHTASLTGSCHMQKLYLLAILPYHGSDPWYWSGIGLVAPHIRLEFGVIPCDNFLQPAIYHHLGRD